MASITDIDGIKDHHVESLRGVGIRTSDDLLEYGSSRRGRRELSKVTGLGDRRITEWVKRADLLRVPGIHIRYSNLLEAAGVDTVRDLRRRNVSKLVAEMERINARRHIVTRLPRTEEVQDWVDAAKKLPVVMR